MLQSSIPGMHENDQINVYKDELLKRQKKGNNQKNIID